MITSVEGRETLTGAPRTSHGVLIVAHAFPPQNLSGARRPYRFAKYLPQCGYEVRVLAAPAAGRPREEGLVRTAPSQTHTSKRTQLESRIVQLVQRHLLPYDDQLAWVPHATAVGAEILRGGSIRAVVSTSPPLATHLAAARLKRRYAVKWVADFRDPLFGNPARTRRIGWLYDAAMERHILGQADAVIANTDAVAELLRKRYPRWAHKISVIWNGYDPEENFGPAPIPPRSYRVLAHVGTLFGRRQPGALLGSLDRLMTRGLLDPAELKVDLLGPMDSNAPWTRAPAFAALVGRGCLRCTNYMVPESEARRAIAEADYLLLLDLHDGRSAVQVPAKLFEYIQVARPILAFSTPNAPVREILVKSGVAHRFLCYSDSPEQIDRELLRFLRLPASPAVVSPWFRKHFAAPEQARTLSLLLDGLLRAV